MKFNKPVIFVLLIVCILSFVSYKYYMHIESEEVWSEINDEYSRISREVELCTYSCQFREDMRDCFSVCKDEMNLDLDRIGIRHDAWRKKYVE